MEANMNNQLFSHVTCDYYTRHYELNPKFTNGLQVTIYAECSPNATGMNGHYYALDLYFSAGEIPVRDHITGVSFGTGPMKKKQIDVEMDMWVEQIISAETFPVFLKDYMRKEELWEDTQNDEYIKNQGNAE